MIDFITYPFGGIILLPKILSFLITLFWIVGITNAVNLLDGLDGLLAGITVISALTFGGVAILKHQFLAAILMLALGGAALGFLPYNFYPAKIFLGDAGSLFIGVILAVLTIMGAFKTTATLALFIPILIMGIPIFDTAYAILRRFLTKKPIFKADREHIHHNLLNLGLSQRQVVCIIYLINFILGILGLILAYYF
ncbi:MAG: undecaprenyl/decaprenyl-phosphate alpha-N-acetylglucosaminyl 1-phosphate transferase [Armatimonadetes bacterium]|nr:undecaprenyl/decaprenyl-phosphate alpha-N-acetylglucosaminyl 1-phosphate transferase [Armatimonadota bacterium]